MKHERAHDLDTFNDRQADGRSAKATWKIFEDIIIKGDKKNRGRDQRRKKTRKLDKRLIPKKRGQVVWWQPGPGPK